MLANWHQTLVQYLLPICGRVITRIFLSGIFLSSGCYQLMPTNFARTFSTNLLSFYKPYVFLRFLPFCKRRFNYQIIVSNLSLFYSENLLHKSKYTFSQTWLTGYLFINLLYKYSRYVYSCVHARNEYSSHKFSCETFRGYSTRANKASCTRRT